MIYLFTAFYAEAQCVIAHYKLKKDTAHTHFQLFENEELKIRLILTGAGNIAAACAVSGTFGEFPPGKGDSLVNIGSAAADANDPSVRDGEIFLCNKITEQTTGRTFYPDVIYRHPFAEAEIVTQAVPYRGANETQDPENRAGARLYDMEAAAVYQAGAYYFGPHQMTFLKVVTDHGVAGDGKTGQPEQIGQKIAAQEEAVCAYIDSLRRITEEAAEECGCGAKQDEEETDIRRLTEDLHASKTMEAMVRQHIRYWTLSGIDYRTTLKEMYASGKLPCRDKREGKNCFEEIRRKLL